MVVEVEIWVECREHERVKAVYTLVDKIDPWSIMSLSLPP